MSADGTKSMLRLCGAFLKPGDGAICFSQRCSLDSATWCCPKSFEEKEIVHDDGEQGLQKRETRVEHFFKGDSFPPQFTR